MRFVFLYTVKSDGLPISASVSIRPGVIGHILTAADVCAVFLRLLLLVVRGFHIQFYDAVFFKPAVIFFTLITRIYADIFNTVAFQIFRKGNERMYICTIRADVVANDELL